MFPLCYHLILPYFFFQNFHCSWKCSILFWMSSYFHHYVLKVFNTMLKVFNTIYNYLMCQIMIGCLLLSHKPTVFSSRLTVWHVKSYDTSCRVILASHKIPQLSYVSNCDWLLVTFTYIYHIFFTIYSLSRGHL